MNIDEELEGTNEKRNGGFIIYQWDELCESQAFEHDQKFVKAEHWKEACNEINDLIKTKNKIQAENKKLREALEYMSNHESDDFVCESYYELKYEARMALKQIGE